MTKAVSYRVSLFEAPVQCSPSTLLRREDPVSGRTKDRLVPFRISPPSGPRATSETWPAVTSPLTVAISAAGLQVTDSTLHSPIHHCRPSLMFRHSPGLKGSRTRQFEAHSRRAGGAVCAGRHCNTLITGAGPTPALPCPAQWSPPHNTLLHLTPLYFTPYKTAHPGAGHLANCFMIPWQFSSLHSQDCRLYSVHPS